MYLYQFLIISQYDSNSERNRNTSHRTCLQPACYLGQTGERPWLGAQAFRKNPKFCTPHVPAGRQGRSRVAVTRQKQQKKAALIG